MCWRRGDISWGMAKHTSDIIIELLVGLVGREALQRSPRISKATTANQPPWGLGCEEENDD
jgi:hypothetical protein